MGAYVGPKTIPDELESRPSFMPKLSQKGFETSVQGVACVCTKRTPYGSPVSKVEAKEQTTSEGNNWWTQKLLGPRVRPNHLVGQFVIRIKESNALRVEVKSKLKRTTPRFVAQQ